MSEKFLDAVKARRSVYALKSESTIPNSKIEEIVQAAVLHAPSTYNVQSARAVVVFKEQHVKVWEIVKGYMEGALAEHPMKDYIFNRIDGFKGSYGTVLWFEDQAALDALGEKNPMITPMLTEFSDHSSGMHQFVAWTALEAEGLGANLQHYNFHPSIVADILKEWDLPATWKLKAQLVFGTPASGPEHDKVFDSIDKRVLIKA